LSSPWTLPALEGVNLRQPAAKKSWVQIARTGKFVSNRYGKFEISKADLSSMLKNFNEITPQPPTQLPIDFDHLSMSPSKPGDGIAAGWVQQLELRDNGDTLFAEIEWTPQAALNIATKQYRFFSPSFAKDYTHKDGKKIGTTLLAGALTNHPFLESMAPVSLTNGRALPMAILEPAVADRQETPPMRLHLSELGTRVTFLPDPGLTPELDETERAATYEVRDGVGAGDDRFCRLVNEQGEDVGWYRVTVLAPAPAPDKAANPPAALVKKETTPQEKAAAAPPAEDEERPTALAADRASDQLLTLATAHAATHKLTLAQATKEIAMQRPDLVEARHGRADDETPETPETPDAPLSLSATERGATSFAQLVTTLQQERKLASTRDAMHLAAGLRPDLAARYSAGDAA